MGVIRDETEIAGYCELLDPRSVEPVEVIIAYLDYLDTTDGVDDNFISTYSMLARRFADGLPSFPWSSYYWTSSDTYCIFGVLGSGEIALRIASFINDLVWVQKSQHVRMEHVGWMWQIGITIAKARVVGDVIIPSRESVMAATLMKRAKLDNKGGGLILVDSAVVRRVDAEGLQELLLLVGSDDPLVGITLQTIGKEGRLSAYELRQVIVAAPTAVQANTPEGL
jgi:hypothetical protein